MVGYLVNAQSQGDKSDVSFVLFHFTASNLKYAVCHKEDGAPVVPAYPELPECIVLFHASLALHTMFLLPGTHLALFSYWLTPTL